MQDGQKAVWSIPYVSVAFFPSLKPNFIAYRSSKVSIAFLQFTSCDNQAFVGCIPIAAVAVDLNVWSSHNMYSNNILNFQETTTILNGHTRKVWKLIVWPSYIYIYIYIWERLFYCFGVFLECSTMISTSPNQVIPNIQKMLLDASLFNTHYYLVHIKGKRSKPLRTEEPSFTPRGGN